MLLNLVEQEKQKKLIGSGSIGKLVVVPETDKKNAEVCMCSALISLTNVSLH